MANTFKYKDIYSQGEHVYVWEISYLGDTLTGSCGSVRNCYRDAKKAVRRHRRIMLFLNKGWTSY